MTSDRRPVPEQAEDILLSPLLRNCLTLNDISFSQSLSPLQNSGTCNSFYCLGHSKNVYDDDDDDDTLPHEVSESSQPWQQQRSVKRPSTGHIHALAPGERHFVASRSFVRSLRIVGLDDHAQPAVINWHTQYRNRLNNGIALSPTTAETITIGLLHFAVEAASLKASHKRQKITRSETILFTCLLFYLCVFLVNVFACMCVY